MYLSRESGLLPFTVSPSYSHHGTNTGLATLGSFTSFLSFPPLIFLSTATLKVKSILLYKSPDIFTSTATLHYSDGQHLFSFFLSSHVMYATPISAYTRLCIRHLCLHTTFASAQGITTSSQEEIHHSSLLH